MTDELGVLERLADLERRVAALEGGKAPAPAGRGAGTVRYAGDVHLHGDVTWEIAVDPAAALDLPDEPRVAVLAALGHPVRARLVRLLLARGPSGTSALQEAAGLASTGQLYHHLRALTHCGLVEQDGRGSYRVDARAVVPALVLLTAASDVAGQLR
ncbi:MAG TPA: helix-turn-helix domain-containing protein [Pseudonocardia sp.]|uniref:ArsR/SmtB family transcription factor n=1 Tax=Pseudonocardia sp. TaxID=60912 RepID=UPI002B4B7845|nr:helix-turn-helix domain-containing protein [Pseudonocardia sp.]HLU59593.1 helix-turn-helix domain-containing protein [Pseudonocardia sp.]